MSLRILGGELGGRILQAPAGARPSEARLRAALFSIWGPRLPGCRFLDLFAGSGAAGLEALSRGAAQATFVEGDRRAAVVLERNLRLAPPGTASLRRCALPSGLARAIGDRGPFDLVFADPPYAFTAHADLLAVCAPLLAAEGELALEHSARLPTPDASAELERCDRRRYGECALSFYRRR